MRTSVDRMLDLADVLLEIGNRLMEVPCADAPARERFLVAEELDRRAGQVAPESAAEAESLRMHAQRMRDGTCGSVIWGLCHLGATGHLLDDQGEPKAVTEAGAGTGEE